MRGHCPPAALLAVDGSILLVSDAWRLLSESEGGRWLKPGANYLDLIVNERIAGDSRSLAMITALTELMAGKKTRCEVAVEGEGEGGGGGGGGRGATRLVMSALAFGGEHYILVEQLPKFDPEADWRPAHVVDGRLLRAQEEERRRIARDLHDSTSQLLVGLQFSIAQLRQGPLGGQLTPVLADCDAALTAIQREIRTISYLCHPPLLGSRSLASALETMTRGFAERAGLGVSMDFEDVGEIAPSVEATFYRLTQEALANIHRHAKASTIAVRLAARRGCVHLLIEDDGIGFEAAATRSTPGVGIAGMKERVEQMAGRLSIRHRRRGTSVLASIPRRRRPAATARGDQPQLRDLFGQVGEEGIDPRLNLHAVARSELVFDPLSWRTPPAPL